jgi:site-specific DNA recombinase
MEKQKVVFYSRTSTALQKEKETIAVQLDQLNEYAKANKLEVVKVFKDEGVSGDLEKRQGFANMYSFLEDNEEVSTVVIYKLDRLARDLYVQEHLIRKLESIDVKLISTQETDLDSKDPVRVAFRQFIGIMSELDKKFIAMRLHAGRVNKIKNKKGHAGGDTPLGYESNGGELQVSGTQAPTIERIFKMNRYGKKSLRQIAKELNNDGVPTARGGKWYPSTVNYILKNKMYKGKMKYGENEATRKDLALL